MQKVIVEFSLADWLKNYKCIKCSQEHEPQGATLVKGMLRIDYGRCKRDTGEIIHGSPQYSIIVPMSEKAVRDMKDIVNTIDHDEF